MIAQAQRPRNVPWLVVTLVALGRCLAQGMQQRLLYPHLQEGSQQQQVQRDFYLRQECSLGFYRENKGYFTGRCVPCNCNGNSNRCQDGTGKCIRSHGTKTCSGAEKTKRLASQRGVVKFPTQSAKPAHLTSCSSPGAQHLHMPASLQW